MEKKPRYYTYFSIEFGNNYFLNWISALVKEMGGNLFRNYEFDFSRVFWVRSSEKHKKYV